MVTFATLEQQKVETLARVEGWSASRLAYRPATGAWSATEVLDHLVRVERGILTAAQHGLRTPHPLGPRDRLGFWFVDRLFRSDRRVRVPASASAVLPDASADVDEVRHRWDATRQDLDRFLAPLSCADLTGGVFRHPVSGWMSVPQILRFFSVHLGHHGVQLARLGAASAGR